MPLTFPQYQPKQPSIDTRLRTLREILYDIERRQQKARPPIPVNTKGAKSVLGIKEHQKHIKDIKTAKQSTLWHKCTSYYRTLLKERNAAKPEKSKKLIKMQQDLLMQQYGRLKRRQEKSLADIKIDMEYEKLQRKYCPNFKLSTNESKVKDTMKFLEDRAVPKTEVIRSPVTYRFPKRQNKNKHKLLKVPKEVKTKKEAKQKSEDSDKTLTQSQEKVATVVGDRKPAGVLNSTKAPATPSLDKYRVLYKTTNLKPLKAMPEIDGSVMANIFYHQSKHNAPPAASLNNKQDVIKRDIQKAIKIGKSTDPLVNNMLAVAIEKAQQERVAWPVIQNIIENYQISHNRKKVLHLLQIQFRQGVFILCTVNTCNFTRLIMVIDKILQHFRCRFAPVLQHFTHCCVIEALLPAKYRHLDTKQLSRYLNKEATRLRVEEISLLDAARGVVSIKCWPVSMPHVTKVLALKGFKIINSDYGFRATKEVILDSKTAAEYRKLMKNLMEIPDIETITDNVSY